MIKILFAALFFISALLTAGTGYCQDQAGKDEKILKDYFAKHKIKATRTPSGLYYTVKRKGAGEKPVKGKTVSINFTASLLDGTVYDSNTDPKFGHVEPYTFTLGSIDVIKGWDEGVQLLNTGEKAMLYIPSRLAYGADAIGKIPANGIIILDVELTKINNQ